MVYHSNSAIDGLDITNYWQYFNLDCDPFAMNIEAALIYLPAYWEEMLDLIQYIVHYKNQLAVVTGTNGTGKTVLADLLEVQLGESVHCIKIAAEHNMTVMRLLEFLSDAFLVPWQANDSIEQILDDQLQAFQHKEKNCLLLIDNAQLLPTETLEALLYMVSQQSENQMRFHMVLFGEPTLQQTLQRMLEPSEEALVHFLTLEPLSLEETTQYLNYRLSAANWQSANPMTEEVIARIYRLSEGNPARINRIARRFLLDLLTEQEESGKNSWLGKHVAQFVGAGLIVIFLIVLAVWIWHSNMVQHVMAKKVTVAAPTVTVNGEALPAAQVKYIDSTTLDSAKTTSEKASVDHTSTFVPPTPAVENSPSQITSAPTPVPTANTAVQPEAPQTTPPPVTPAPTAAPIADTPSAAMNNAAASANTTQPTASAHSKTSAAQKTASAANDKGAYTIWLIHLQYKGTLAQFIKDNHLENKIHVVTRHVKGKTIKEITYGSYKTMNDAEQAVASLPPNLMSAGPWPKKKDG